MFAAIPFPNLSPEIFAIDLFGMHFALRWYAMAYLVGVVIGWRLSVMALRRAVLWRNDTPPMSPDDAEDLMTWIILGVIGGGRDRALDAVIAAAVTQSGRRIGDQDIADTAIFELVHDAQPEFGALILLQP